MQNKNEIFYAIALRHLEGVGDLYAREIIRKSGSAAEFFLNGMEVAKENTGHTEWWRKICKSRDHAIKEAERIIQYCEKNRIMILTFFDSRYPRRLFYLPDAPFLIYYYGDPCWDEDYALAVVGTRSPDGYGQKSTMRIIEELVPYYPLIVSGMALGVDGYAHYAAIKNGLKTIGVMGHGLDTIYPPQHKKLAREILDKGGMLVSEFSPGTPPEPQYFPRRNRIVAGLCDALLVVQSRTKGGSMITATLAHSYNKDVFAIPGLCGEPLSEGTNGLIKMNKAALAESGEDIAFAMNWRKKKTEQEQNKEKVRQTEIPVGHENHLLTSLKFKKRFWEVDEIIHELNLPYSEVARSLTIFELNGFIKRHPGNKVEFL